MLLDAKEILEMPISPFLAALRDRVGNDLLLLPAVTAVICDGPRFLLALHRDSAQWSFVGGGIEPGEEPAVSLEREVTEELGVTPVIGRIIGAYGGEPLHVMYPNGDEANYVTIAYECTIPDAPLELEDAELLQVGWFDRTSIASLNRQPWIDRVIDDASR